MSGLLSGEVPHISLKLDFVDWNFWVNFSKNDKKMRKNTRNRLVQLFKSEFCMHRVRKLSSATLTNGVRIRCWFLILTTLSKVTSQRGVFRKNSKGRNFEMAIKKKPERFFKKNRDWSDSEICENLWVASRFHFIHGHDLRLFFKDFSGERKKNGKMEIAKRAEKHRKVRKLSDSSMKFWVETTWTTSRIRISHFCTNLKLPEIGFGWDEVGLQNGLNRALWIFA